MGISLKFATWHLNFAKFHKVSKNFRQLEVDVALNFTKFHEISQKKCRWFQSTCHINVLLFRLDFFFVWTAPKSLK
jgi:hypothetical protein